MSRLKNRRPQSNDATSLALIEHMVEGEGWGWVVWGRAIVIMLRQELARHPNNLALACVNKKQGGVDDSKSQVEDDNGWCTKVSSIYAKAC